MRWGVELRATELRLYFNQAFFLTTVIRGARLVLRPPECPPASLASLWT